MEEGTRNVIIHNIIMVSFAVLFMFYFDAVKNSPELQKQVIENSPAIPIGQVLAYEGYFGYVILKLIRRFQQKRKIKRTLSNIVVLGGRVIHEYVTQVVDFIAISITSLGFFIYSNPMAAPDSFRIMDFSHFYFIVLVPIIGILTHLYFFKKKLEYR